MPLDLSPLPLAAIAAVFVASALAIGYAGTKLAGIADQLADRTGMGEIMAGALFVGASTSLPGAITSMVTAAQGYPGLAIGNALGGLTAQTTFLAVADLAYRRANLEHAAASVTGLSQGTLLVSLLTVPLLAAHAPPFTILGVHPASVVLLVSYGLGLRMLARIKDEPMWSPVQTQETRAEIDPEEEAGAERESTARLWRRFGIHGGVTALAGYMIGEASVALVDQTGLSETAIGTTFAAISNSLPELVTAIAAVRRGAVNLAVGDIIGGNSFEVLFLAAADIFYREGSIYHAFTTANVFTAVVAILMTGVLLLGMLRRERYGVAGIGFESAIVLVLYAGSLVLVFS
jgi:cation:H+ antiporter